MRNYGKLTKATGAATATLAALTLAACGGYDNSKKDKGSVVIAKCPPGFVDAKTKPIESRETYSALLGSAVTRLSAILPMNGFGQKKTSFPSGLSEIDERKVTAGQYVFHTKGHGDDVFTGGDATSEFVTGPETKLDDLSEQVCIDGGDIFPSPAASTAIGAMEAAGIDVKALAQQVG